MKKDVQAKNISDRLALETIKRLSVLEVAVYGDRERHVIYPAGTDHPVDVWAACAALGEEGGFPPRVVVAKYRALERRRLITGCLCGCRGDLEITEAGVALLTAS